MMEVSMSLNALVRLPLSNSRRSHDDVLLGHSLWSSSDKMSRWHHRQPRQRQHVTVVQAKGKRGMTDRQFQRPPPPSLPQIEDDGNPKFVIFIRMANVYLWYPLSIITGGTTAKIMVAAKDNILGKYIYKDTLARNLAAVIYKGYFIACDPKEEEEEKVQGSYFCHVDGSFGHFDHWILHDEIENLQRDEKEIQKTAFKQYRVLRSAKDFRYGYKLVENNNLRAALSTSDVIELPRQEELKTVVDKVKDFFGDAKESFGKLTALNSTTTEELEENSKEEVKVKD